MEKYFLQFLHRNTNDFIEIGNHFDILHLLYVTAQLRLISVCFKSLFLSFRSQALGVTVIDNDSGSDNDTKLGVFF